MWLYGFHPVREALRYGAPRLERVLMARRGERARAQEIRRLCAAAGVPLEEVEGARLDSLVDGVHNGLAAEIASEAPRAAGSVAEPTDGRSGVAPSAGLAADPRGSSGTAEPADAAAGVALAGRPVPDSVASVPPGEIVVLAEDVQDPRNLGALIRVCDATGVSRLLLRDRGSAPVGATAVKTSAGAAEWFPVERVANAASEIERLKEAGFWVYGAAGDGAAPWELDLRGRVVLCIGGEEKGLRRLTRERCDGLIGLPMAGRVESLNLATAAAAILYEIVRQRGG